MIGKVTGAGRSGVLKKTLLWENPKPTESFSGSLSFDYSTYDYLMLEVEVAKTITVTQVNIVKVLKGSSFSITSTENSSSGLTTTRKCSMNDACNSLAFSSGYRAMQADAMTSRCIPTAIYGIKGKIK